MKQNLDERQETRGERTPVKMLGDMCLSKSCIGRASKTFETDEVIQYIDIASIDNQKKEITSLSPMKMGEAPSRAQQCVQKNDVLVSLVRPNLRNVAIVADADCNLVASSGFSVLRADKNIEPRYIFHFVCSDKFTDYLIGLTAGANYPAVRDDDVKNAPVPVPPLDEQQRIVAELDLLTEVIDKRRMQLNELETLAQSIFYDMFGDPTHNEKGWDVKKWEKVFRMKSGDGLTVKDFINGVYPVYGGNGISGFHNAYNKDGSYIVIGRVGAYCGNVRFVQGKFWLTDNAFELFFDSKSFNFDFLCRMLNTYDLHQYANQAAQPVISNTTLKGIDVILPPIKLQQEFADKIQSIEKQKATVNQSIAETQKLLDYTMDKYFG